MSMYFPGKRTGSAMVESAIYFPLIILTAVFAIIMMIHMYQSLAYRCALHEELRSRAGTKADTGSYARDEKADRFTIAERKSAHLAKYKIVKKLGTDRLEAEGSLTVSGGILTNYLSLSTPVKARVYILDEQQLVRYYVDF